MDAMDEQDYLIENYTKKLLDLCNSHIQTICRIEFILNKEKIFRSLHLLTADVINNMREIPLNVEKDIAITYELSKI